MKYRKTINTQVKTVLTASEKACREYAPPGGRQALRQEKTDWSVEREKVKEMLLPYIKEAVKKQLKEEREYYRSRPSLAAKQAEQMFGAGGLENVLVPAVTVQVYEWIEEQMRREWIRKGR